MVFMYKLLFLLKESKGRRSLIRKGFLVDVELPNSGQTHFLCRTINHEGSYLLGNKFWTMHFNLVKDGEIIAFDKIFPRNKMS